MLMQFQDTASLLSAIIIICFSFCISAITFWFKNAKALPRLLGYSFSSAFSFNLAALLINDHGLSVVFSQTAEPLLLLLIALLLAAKPDQKKYILFSSILIIVPAALFLIVIYSLPARSFLAQPLTAISASAAISAAILYLLKNEKEDTNLLFWSILPLLASGFAQYYLSFGIMAFAAPLLRLAAYSVLLAFFYRVFFKSQLIKLGEAEKKLSIINRSIDYEVKKRMLDIEKVNQSLLNISKTDSMSKVLNKAALLDSIDNLIRRNPKSEFSILMLDIDSFKTINDTLGHITGDKCIKMLAAAARNNIRDFDLIGRYGGDEFVIVLPDIETNHALMIAERFRRHVDSSDSPHYTVSIGIASYPADGTDVKALITAADEGLYRSKRKGRNAVSHRSFY